MITCGISRVDRRCAVPRDRSAVPMRCPDRLRTSKSGQGVEVTRKDSGKADIRSPTQFSAFK